MADIPMNSELQKIDKNDEYCGIDKTCVDETGFETEAEFYEFYLSIFKMRGQIPQDATVDDLMCNNKKKVIHVRDNSVCEPCPLPIDYSKWENVKDMYAATYNEEWASEDSSDDFSTQGMISDGEEHDLDLDVVELPRPTEELWKKS